MIYVGIDIAKNTHWASAMNSDGEILLEPFSFQNNNEGFQKFIFKLSSFDKQKILIGLESTAHYGENIISYLFNLDYKIGIINPIQTSNSCYYKRHQQHKTQRLKPFSTQSYCDEKSF